jgi:hypothetical protein
VEEYLTHKGYFVQRNIKYRPDKNRDDSEAKAESVHSDIDVFAFNPKEVGPRRVLAVNIKSWQSGFDFSAAIQQIEGNKIISGRESHLRYRELCIPKWSRAFLNAIKARTGEQSFTHVLAVTLGKGDQKVWTEYAQFAKALERNSLAVLTLKQIVPAIEPNLTKHRHRPILEQLCSFSGRPAFVPSQQHQKTHSAPTRKMFSH